MLIFEYPFWIISIDQCFKQKNTINNKIHRYYQTEITPCYSERWYRTGLEKMLKADLGVLILIVVDDGLVPFEETDGSKKTNGLNPCCSGQWSRTMLIMHEQGENSKS